MLSFVGIPPERQVLAVGTNVEGSHERSPRRQPRQISDNPADPRRCVVLVPFAGYVTPQCERGLRELERRGYAVRRVGGYANIDLGRNQMATDALVDGYEETMWIDADVEFHPDAVDRLRSHGLPIVGGVYPQKGKRSLACHVIPGTGKLGFGGEGGLVEVLYAGTGFLLVRREVYTAIQERLELPLCNERFRRPMVPFFLSMLHPYEDGCWYLGDDYAFCQRAGVRLHDHGRHDDPPLALRQSRFRLGGRGDRAAAARFVRAPLRPHGRRGPPGRARPAGTRGPARPGRERRRVGGASRADPVTAAKARQEKPGGRLGIHALSAYLVGLASWGIGQPMAR